MIVKLVKYKHYLGYITLNNKIKFEKIAWFRLFNDKYRVIGRLGNMTFMVREENMNLFDYEKRTIFIPSEIKTQEDIDKFIYVVGNYDDKNLVRI